MHSDNMRKNIKILSLFLFFGITILLIMAGIKGKVGETLLYQSSDVKNIEISGPFESSGSTSRYALTEAIVEDKTIILNEQRAKFASPDVAEYNGKYFTLFTPGVSFIGVPFYFIGKILKIPQILTFLSSSIFAIINMGLIIYLGRKFGLGFYASLLSGFLFLFATNALSYSFTFTQHQASTMIILLGTLNALGKRNSVNNIIYGLLYGIGLFIDIPNGLMMLPQVIYILLRHFEIKWGSEKLRLKFSLNYTTILVGLIPILILFGLYNYFLTNSFTQIAQAVGRTEDFSAQAEFVSDSLTQKEFSGYTLETRGLINGLPILLVSNQRGLFYYNSVVVFGLISYILFYRKNHKKIWLLLIFSIVIVNILTYSMHLDPYGGWAFGPRYLIPATALLSIGIGKFFQQNKSFLYYLIPLVICFYGVGVNVLGAMTSTQVPPKVEAVMLLKETPYTYVYNWQLLGEGKISSLLYNALYANKISPEIYVYTYFYICILVVLTLFILIRNERRILYE